MDFQPKYTISVLKEGYKSGDKGVYNQSSTSILIQGPHTVLVETGTPSETSTIQKALKKHGVSPEHVEYVVCTHAHPENIGNLALFPAATHIVGYDVMKGNTSIHHDFYDGIEYEIEDDLQVVPTPGFVPAAVSVLVQNSNLGSVAIAGSIFHSAGDLEDPDLWEEYSREPEVQQESRIRVLEFAQWIVPRYGAPFCVPDSFRSEMKVVMTP